MGIVGSYYKGIMATSSMSGRFRVLIKLLYETFKDMIPYTIILITQIMLFAILSKTSQITAITHGVFDEDSPIPTFLGELGV